MISSVRNTVDYYLNKISNFLSTGETVRTDVVNSSVDYAGRLRVSGPIPLGDYKLVANRLPQFFNTVTSGDASVEYGETLRSHEMRTESNGDYAIVQTYQSHNYFAGKSQVVEFTAFNFHNEPNIEKRCGYYTSNYEAPYNSDLDGFYIYTDGIEHYLRIVNKGTIIANVPRSEWDDPLDGSGPSRFEIDWEKFNIFLFSFLWLGGAGLNFAIVVGNRHIPVYKYTHIGNVNSDKLIFSKPGKPVRMELRQTGVGTGKFDPVCITVLTEGTDISGSFGEVLSINSGATNNIKLSHPQRGAVVGLRLQEDSVATTFEIINVDTFASTINDFYRWELVINPSLVDGDGNPKALSFSRMNSTNIFSAIGDGTTFAVGGTTVQSGYGGSRITAEHQIESARKLGIAIDGTADQMWLVITPLQSTTNIDVFGEITVKYFV